jgi:hypothetical protein
MAGVKDNALIKLLGFPQGLDNLSAETELPIGKPGPGGAVQGALRVADNVDIDEAGKVARRRGYTLRDAQSDMHSGWSHPQYPYMLAVIGSNLVKYDRTLARTTVVALTARPGTRMSYDYDAGYVYYCNGFDSGRIDLDGNRSAWALNAPIGQPLLQAHSAGGLAAGHYQVAITYRDDTGRESGSTLAATIELTAGQGIRLLNIPQPADADATWIRVYVTETNGEVLRYCQDIPAGLSTLIVGVHQAGAPLATQFHEPLPAGQIVRLYRGRMYVFRHNVLYWSEAMHYGQGVLHANYLHFNDDGALLEGVHVGNDAGLYIGAGKRTYFLSGSEPKQWQRAIAHPHGAVVGSATQVNPSILGMEGSGTLPYWLDSAGQFVVGQPGGRVQRVSDRYAAPSDVETAATLVRETGGLRQVVSTLRGGTTNPFAVADRAEAEVWRNGVRVD